MHISSLQANFLTALAMMSQAGRILELGTFAGYSAMALARGLKKGQLMTCDHCSDHLAMAQRHWSQLTCCQNIEFVHQNALDLLKSLLIDQQEQTFDLIFIDADKKNYIRYYELSLQLLRIGGVVVLDNTLWHGDVLHLEPHTKQGLSIKKFNRFILEDTRVFTHMSPLGDGLTVCIKHT